MTDRGLINDLLSQVTSTTKYVPYYTTGCKYRITRMITTLTINEEATDLLRGLISNGSDLNIPNDEGEYPIEVACRLDDRGLFNLMIRHGADPSHSSESVHSYLCKYADSFRLGETFILKKYTLKPLIRMIVRGADIHQPCKSRTRNHCHPTRMLHSGHDHRKTCLVIGRCEICDRCNGMFRLPSRLFSYHLKRVRVVSSFLDLYDVCNDVGLLIRSFGGECVKCIGK